MRRKLLITVMSALLSIPGFSQSKQRAAAELSVKEGAAGVFIFTGNNPSGNSAQPGKVYRSAGNDRDYREIGQVRPAATAEEFRKMAGANSLRAIARLKKLPGEQEAFAYTQTYRDMADYGLGSLNPGFIRAMGACYLDEQAGSLPAGTRLYYKVAYTGGPGQTSEVPGSLVLGTKPAIAKPLGGMVKENDSSITVSWTSTLAASPDAMMGMVFREKGNSGRYEKAGYVMAQQDGQQRITYQWKEDVTPGIDYRYFLVPVTLTELAGPASDTVRAISRNFRNTEIITLRRAKDSTDGIFLEWLPVKQAAWYTGIILERNKKQGEAYLPVDTIEVGATSYTDTKVIPNTIYHYRLRLLTVRGNLSDPSAAAAATRIDKHFLPSAPTELKAALGDKGVVSLSWRPSPETVVAGYLVYRSDREGGWELVSNQMSGSSFTDTIASQATGDYKYTVRAISYSETQSMPADPVFVRWVNKTPSAAAPGSFTGYAEPGKSVLVWRDIRNAANDLVSYNVYRMKAKAAPATVIAAGALQRSGFEKLNDGPLTAAYYNDRTVAEGERYIYAVAGVTGTGIEGVPGAFLVLDIPVMAIGTPAAVSVRPTSAGAVIDWGRVMQDKVEGYEIYRRTTAQAEPVKIGNVNAGQDSFTDKTASAGELYFYSIRAVGKGAASRRTEEKGVRL